MRALFDPSSALLALAAAVSFAGFFLHVVGGGRMFVRPLLADAHLTPEVKWLGYVSWHVTSILLLGSAVAFAYTARHPGELALAVFAIAMHAAVAGLCLIVGVRLHPIMLRLPAIYLFGVIALLGAAGVAFSAPLPPSVSRACPPGGASARATVVRGRGDRAGA